MSRRSRADSGPRAARRDAAARPPEAPSAAAAPPSPVAYRALALVAFACAALSVSYLVYDTDIWQHLAVGRAIWTLHRIPHEHLWTWPSYGQPDVLPSWLFRVLLWPWYATAGIWGLQAWRYLTTIASFAILLATARRMGARGLVTLVVLVLCALSSRQRTMMRPETLVAVLFALELWILETRRHGGRDHAWWLVPLMLVWTNAHVSYPIGLGVIGAYLLHDGAEALRDRERRPAFLRLGLVILAAAGTALVNPFGVRGAWAPFDFALHQSREPLFQTIDELRPLNWREHLGDGLLVLMVAWPALAILRPGRRGWDLAEWILMAVFTWQTIASQRFMLYYALAAMPFVSTHLDAWVGAGWPTALRGTRAGIALAAVCAVITAIEVSGPLMPFGIGFQYQMLPPDAADFMQAHGVRGRGFNYFYQGGYLLWRFWPDRSRLPFMDIHQSGTVRDRALYEYSLIDRGRWHQHQRERQFDYLLLRTPYSPQDHLLEFVEEDSTWALVFLDDASALYVRRGGPLQAVADSFAYAELKATARGVAALGARLEVDPVLRATVRRELEREAAESRRAASAHSMLANIALLDGRYDDARRELTRARAIESTVPRIEERLGIAALLSGRPEEALGHFLGQRRENPVAGIDFRIGQAWSALGDRMEARDAYAREVQAHPDWPGARDSLAALEQQDPR